MPPKKKAEAKALPKAKVRATKQQESTTGSRASRAADLMEYVDKKMDGRAELCLASDYSLPYYTKRLPTGILSLDIKLGGGWPAGAISQIIGPKNAGKDYLIWQTIRQLQGILGKKLHVLLAQTEMRADRTQAQKVGCAVALSDGDVETLDRANIANGRPPFTKEHRAQLKHQIGTIHEAHGYAVEDLYDIILRGIESRVYHLVVINSFGSIMSGAEAESESLREKTYAGTAGPNTQFLHKLNALLTMRTDEGESRDTCVLGINQIRDDIKNPNKAYKSSGGNALEHAKFVDLFITSGAAHGKEMMFPSAIGQQQMKDVWGKDVNWEIKKGKAGIHEGERGRYIYQFFKERNHPSDPIIPVNNANFYLDYATVGATYGVIDVAGSWHTLLGPNGEELLKANSKGKFAMMLEEDVLARAEAGDPNSYMNYIRTVCLQRADINVNYATMFEGED